MTLAQINYLLQVIECGSIKKAAEVLGIKRTTLQMSLDALEKELGRKLLDRQKEGTALSAESAVLYPVLLDMQKEILHMEELRRHWQQNQQINIFSASAVLLPLLEKLNSTYLSAAETAKSVIRLETDAGQESDLIFMLAPPDNIPPGRRLYALFDSPYCACLRRSHPWAANESLELNCRQTAYPVLMLGDNAANKCAYQSINNLSSLQRIISSSDCLALIPEIFLKLDVVPFSRLTKALRLNNNDLRFSVFLLAPEEPQAAAADYLHYILTFFKEEEPC